MADSDIKARKSTNATDSEHLWSTGHALNVAVTGGYAGPDTHANAGISTAYTGTAAVTTAITGTLIDVLTTSTAFLSFGSTGSFTATTNGYYVPPNVTYRFPITSGDMASAIQQQTAGTMYVHVVS